MTSYEPALLHLLQVLPSKSLLMEGVFSLLITLWVCIYLEVTFFLNTNLFAVIPFRGLTGRENRLNINTWTDEGFLTFHTRLTETKQRV